MPLTYDPNRVVVVAASSHQRFLEECEKYNYDPNSPGMHVVFPEDFVYFELREDGTRELREDGTRELEVDDATRRAAFIATMLTLPAATPWNILGDVTPGMVAKLKSLFGPSQTFSNAVQVSTVDVAWPRSYTDRI